LVIPPMAKITILGAGAMGSALTIPLADNGHDIKLWFTEFDKPILNALAQGREHPRLKTRLPKEISLYGPSSLKEAVEDSEVIVIAVSSKGVYPITQRLRDVGGYEGKIVMTVTKGIEEFNGEFMTMTQVISKNLGGVDIVFVSGPSLAAELSRRMPTHVVYSSVREEVALEAKKIFETQYYRISVTSDVIGTELCAALKNPYAIAYGIVEGYSAKNSVEGYKNLRASMITKSVSEMAEIVSRLGGKKETAFGLSGFGDLYVTCLGGRNGLFGRLLGSGLSVEEAFKEMKARNLGVVEGYANALTLHNFLLRKGIGPRDAPIIHTVYKILYEGYDATKVINVL